MRNLSSAGRQEVRPERSSNSFFSRRTEGSVLRKALTLDHERRRPVLTSPIPEAVLPRPVAITAGDSGLRGAVAGERLHLAAMAPGCAADNRLIVLLLMSGLTALWGCQRESASESLGAAAPSSSLDRMQMGSARRVAIETATSAMQRRDLAQLKQLSVWVRHRAQSVILEKDDLQALDTAIACLEQTVPIEQSLARANGIATGALSKPARELCRGRAGQ